tara:strand:+ start:2411 stop:2956 length:546 start_codon:yes stop_codon:yes gene_type:complete
MKHLQLRNTLNPAELEEKSTQIQKNLFELPEYTNSKIILFYVSIASEPQTHEMIKQALADGKKVAVPITSFRDKTLCLSEISSLGDLEKKETGLIEPKKEKICNISLEQIDLVIVPGVCFDKEGYRIGYGGGFYDRLLRNAKHETAVVGLCFAQNIEQSIPRQSHDAKMNKIVTEMRVIEI